MQPIDADTLDAMSAVITELQKLLIHEVGDYVRQVAYRSIAILRQNAAKHPEPTTEIVKTAYEPDEPTDREMWVQFAELALAHPMPGGFSAADIANYTLTAYHDRFAKEATHETH